MAEPPRIVWVIAGLLACTFVMIPLGGRDDWQGWLAFVVGSVALAVICGSILSRAVKAWREPPE